MEKVPTFLRRARRPVAGALLAAALTACTEPEGTTEGSLTTFPYAETPDIPYATDANPLQGGRAVTLRADLYRPAGSSAAPPPLLVYLHGGWFVSGTRKDDAELFRALADRGVAVASIEYRLAPLALLSDRVLGNAAFMAMQDARAAVRHFRARAAEYGIDPDAIHAGGCSAGAYAALLAAHLDRPAEVPAFVDTALVGGGLEGDAEDPGIPSAVAGAVNVSGGVFDTAWIEAGGPPLASAQCLDDPTVPPGRATLRDPLTGRGLLVAYGSSAVHQRAIAAGVPSALLSLPGSCHCPHTAGAAYRDSTADFIARALLRPAEGGSGAVAAAAP